MRVDVVPTTTDWSNMALRPTGEPGAIPFADLLTMPELRPQEKDAPITAFAFHALGMFGLDRPVDPEAAAPLSRPPVTPPAPAGVTAIEMAEVRACTAFAEAKSAATKSLDHPSQQPVVARHDHTAQAPRQAADATPVQIEHRPADNQTIEAGLPVSGPRANWGSEELTHAIDRARARPITSPADRPHIEIAAEIADAPATAEPTAPEHLGSAGKPAASQRQLAMRDVRPNPLVLFEDGGQAGLAFQCASLSPSEFQAFRRRAEALLDEHGLALTRLSHNGKTQSKVMAQGRGGSTWR